MEIAFWLLGGILLMITAVLGETLLGKRKKVCWVVFCCLLASYTYLGIRLELKRSSEQANYAGKIEASVQISNELLKIIRSPAFSNTESLGRIEANLSQLNQHVKMQPQNRPFAVPDQLLSRNFKKLSLRIADLARDSIWIKDKTFEDCDIYGPAVIAYQGINTIVSSTIKSDHPDAAFIATSQNWLQGVVVIKDCMFLRCTFHGISFIGPPDKQRDFMKGFSHVY